MTRSDIGPYTIVPEWILRTAISAGAVRCYLELGLMANRSTGAAWPSRQTLADRCHVSSRRTVDAWLAELEGVGAITKKARHKGRERIASLYLVQYAAPPSAAEDTTPSAADSAQNQNHLEPEPITIGFVDFWREYPKRVAKAAAERAWAKALQRAEPEDIVAGAIRYRDDSSRRPDYTANPATWLNSDRWLDEEPETSHPLAAVPDIDFEAQQRARWAEEDAAIAALREQA